MPHTVKPGVLLEITHWNDNQIKLWLKPEILHSALQTFFLLFEFWAQPVFYFKLSFKSLERYGDEFPGSQIYLAVQLLTRLYQTEFVTGEKYDF